jgi:hypothetical protein
MLFMHDKVRQIPDGGESEIAQTLSAELASRLVLSWSLPSKEELKVKLMEWVEEGADANG